MATSGYCSNANLNWRVSTGGDIRGMVRANEAFLKLATSDNGRIKHDQQSRSDCFGRWSFWLR
jgi:hypothetical protein